MLYVCVAMLMSTAQDDDRFTSAITDAVSVLPKSQFPSPVIHHPDQRVIESMHPAPSHAVLEGHITIVSPLKISIILLTLT